MGILVGCERSDPAPRGFGQNENDYLVDVYTILSVTDVENTLIAAYHAALPLLRGADLALARRLLAQEHEHLATWAAVLARLGLRPHAPASHYPFSRLSSASQALDLAAQTESTTIAFYQDALPKFGHPVFRATAAAIMTSEAEHAAVLATARGLPAASGAFVRGTA